MRESFQHEMPKSRINITLDVETHGATLRKELPLKLLVLGDFSGGQDRRPLSARQRIEVDKNNLDQVMKNMQPRLSLVVQHKLNAMTSELPVDLTFESIQAFSPVDIVKQVPALNRLLAMRNLLKDLKSHLGDNQSLCRALEEIVQQPETAKKLSEWLKEKVQ